MDGVPTIERHFPFALSYYLHVGFTPSRALGNRKPFPDLFNLGLRARFVSNQAVTDDSFESYVGLAFFLGVVLDSIDLFGIQIALRRDRTPRLVFDSRVVTKMERAVFESVPEEGERGTVGKPAKVLLRGSKNVTPACCDPE